MAVDGPRGARAQKCRKAVGDARAGDRLDEGARSHGEVGYWRVAGDRVELVLSLQNGVVEVAEGAVTGTTIELETTAVACTGSAKPVTALRRRDEVDGDTPPHEVWMAAVGMPLTCHFEVHRHIAVHPPSMTRVCPVM